MRAWLMLALAALSACSDAQAFRRAVRKGARGGSPYQNAVMTDAPTGYWRLGDPSGTTATATAGSNGTYSGTWTLAQTGATVSDSDTSVKVGASGANIDFGTSFAPEHDTPFTVEFFAKCSDVSANPTPAADAAATTYRGWFVLFESGGDFSFYVVNNIGSLAYTAYRGISGGKTSDGAWHHYAAVYHGSGTPALDPLIHLYIDGSEPSYDDAFGSGLHTSTMANSDAMWIGKNPNGNQYPVGAYIDEFAVYSTDLSGARISAHYSAR